MTFALFYWYLSDALKASTPLVIGAVAVYIAGRQWITAQKKLQLDLFERRFKVYDALAVFMHKSLLKYDVKYDLIEHFRRDVAQAEFIFPSSVTMFINDVIKKAFNHYMYQESVQKNFPNHERAISVEAFEDFEDFESRMVEMFKPYIDFRDLSQPEPLVHISLPKGVEQTVTEFKAVRPTI